MTITYEEARELVRSHCEPGWTHGTFCLDDRKIVESDDVYIFEVGARECLVDGDASYQVFGGMPIVFKEDGRLGSLPSVMIAMDPGVRVSPNPKPTLTV